MEKYISKTVNETQEIAKALAAALKGGDVVAFFGDLGAGKTVFTRAIVNALGYDGYVTSPTFAVVNEYETKPTVYHFDMYRIDSEDALYGIVFFDYLENGGICIIEWSENIEYALPENTIRISIQGSGDEERIITVER